MAAIDPVGEGHRWLQTVLAADPGVVAVYGDRIARHPAPRDWAYPLLTHAFYTSRGDLRVVGQAVVWSELRYIVTGYAAGNNEAALTAGAAAVQAALHGQSGFTPAARVIACWRDRPLSLPETIDAVEYRRLGAIYVLQVAPV